MLALRLCDKAQSTIGKAQAPALADGCIEQYAFFQRIARFVIASELYCHPAEVVQCNGCEAGIANEAPIRHDGL